jgi:hypothetical protein
MSSCTVIAHRQPVSELVPSTIIPPFEAETDAWLRAVAADRRLPTRARLVAVSLAMFERDPTCEEIGKAVGCSRLTALRAMLALVKRGWVDRIVS